MASADPDFERLTSSLNLYEAFRLAAKGKRGRPDVARVEWRLEDLLVERTPSFVGVSIKRNPPEPCAAKARATNEAFVLQRNVSLNLADSDDAEYLSMISCCSGPPSASFGNGTG